jgi:hypothetical protein
MHFKDSSEGMDNSNPSLTDKVDKEIMGNRALHSNIIHQMHLLG